MCALPLKDDSVHKMRFDFLLVLTTKTPSCLLLPFLCSSPLGHTRCASTSRAAFTTFCIIYASAHLGLDPIHDHGGAHVSVNTSLHTSSPHCFTPVKPNVVYCDLGVRVRWRTRCGPGVTHAFTDTCVNNLTGPGAVLTDGDAATCVSLQRDQPPEDPEQEARFYLDSRCVV